MFIKMQQQMVDEPHTPKENTKEYLSLSIIIKIKRTATYLQ